MSKAIRIGSVCIPLDNYIVGGTALLGIRESGKTYGAKGIAEQLLDYGVPIIVFDAIGMWRWLKVPAPGGRGFKVVVAGGNAPDLPLTPASAAEIVRAAIREDIPLVLDLYDKKLSKADWRRIVQTCFRTLLYENVGLRHIFLEETAEYAPQKIIDGETYAEVEKLVRMGGNASLGITLINQRSQEVNKAVLDLCENLVLMRQRGSHAIDSLEKWMDKLSPVQARAVAASLPQLGQGDCWVITGASEELVRTHTDAIQSFHPDRRKPQAAEKAASSTTDTAEFVQRLSGKLQTVIAEAETNDPKMLRKRIADLEAQLKSSSDSSATYAARHEGFQEGKRAGAQSERRVIVDALSQWQHSLKDQILQAVRTGLMEVRLPPELGEEPGAREENPDAVVLPPRTAMARPEPLAQARGNGTSPAPARARQIDARASALPIGEAAVLTACIQFTAGRTRQQLQVLTGYKKRSIEAYVPRLVERGYVENRSGTVIATAAGREALPDAAELPRGDALQRFWFERLPEGEARVLQEVLKSRTSSLTRDQLVDITGYAQRSIEAYVPRLAARGLVVSSRGEVRASEELFA